MAREFGLERIWLSRAKSFISFDSMPLEGPDQLHLRAGHGYIELELFEEANAELEEIDPFCRHLPEVLIARLAIYHGLKKWDLLAVVAGQLVDWNPQEPSFRNDSDGGRSAANRPQLGPARYMDGVLDAASFVDIARLQHRGFTNGSRVQARKCATCLLQHPSTGSRNSTERIQKENGRISTTPFLLWHFLASTNGRRFVTIDAIK